MLSNVVGSSLLSYRINRKRVFRIYLSLQPLFFTVYFVLPNRLEIIHFICPNQYLLLYGYQFYDVQSLMRVFHLGSCQLIATGGP